MIGRRSAIGGLMAWWAAGNARQPLGPQAREAARPDRKPLGTTRAGVGPAPSQGTFIGRLVIISGTGPNVGLFAYSPSPGAGNLIASIAAGGGTDPYGNAYVQGIASYAAGTPANNAEMTAGALRFNEPSNNAAAVVGSNSSAALILSSGQVNSTDTEASISLDPGLSGVAPVAVFPGGCIGLFEAIAIPSPASGLFSGPKLFGNAKGHLGYVADTNNGDGNTYDTGRLTLFLASAFTINSTTPQTIFSKALGIGTYEVEVWAVVLNSTAADGAGFAFAFSGTATGLMDYEAIDTAGTVAYVASNTLTTQGNSFGVAGNQRIEFRMTITVTVAGTLTWTGKELVAANTVSVIQGSRMRVCPVVAT